MDSTKTRCKFDQNVLQKSWVHFLLGYESNCTQISRVRVFFGRPVANQVTGLTAPRALQ